jgi:hypothetical protein
MPMIGLVGQDWDWILENHYIYTPKSL